MADSIMFFVFVGVALIGFISTIIYWFVRYYFNTDQEKAEIGIHATTQSSDSEKK